MLTAYFTNATATIGDRLVGVRLAIVLLSLLITLTLAGSLTNDWYKRKYCTNKATARVTRFVTNDTHQRVAVITYQHPIFGQQEIVRARIDDKLPAIDTEYTVYLSTLNPADTYLESEMPTKTNTYNKLIVCALAVTTLITMLTLHN